MSGSVTPTTGSVPLTMPMLMSDVPEHHRRDADADGGAEAIARLAGDLQDPEDQDQVGEQQHRAADEAPLLGPDGEREVGPQRREVPQADLGAVQVPLAEEPPRADGVQRLPRLVRPLRVGVEERLHALALILVQQVLVDRERRDRRQAHDRAPASSA